MWHNELEAENEDGGTPSQLIRYPCVNNRPTRTEKSIYNSFMGRSVIIYRRDLNSFHSKVFTEPSIFLFDGDSIEFVNCEFHCPMDIFAQSINAVNCRLFSFPSIMEHPGYFERCQIHIETAFPLSVVDVTKEFTKHPNQQYVECNFHKDIEFGPLGYWNWTTPSIIFERCIFGHRVDILSRMGFTFTDCVVKYCPKDFHKHIVMESGDQYITKKLQEVFKEQHVVRLVMDYHGCLSSINDEESSWVAANEKEIFAHDSPSLAALFVKGTVALVSLVLLQVG